MNVRYWCCAYEGTPMIDNPATPDVDLDDDPQPGENPGDNPAAPDGRNADADDPLDDLQDGIDDDGDLDDEDGVEDADPADPAAVGRADDA